MKRPLSLQTVVITGASSGIGRQTALAFAEEGATVVLAARNEMALHTAVETIEARGGRAHAVVTDVTDWEQVQRLAEEAVAINGRIDVWVNNAGVSTYGTIQETTPEELRRVVEVNLAGVMYGVRAVLPHMAVQGEGTIINVGSVLSKRSVPLQAAYCASKHGVKGYTEALRVELARDHPRIKAVLVMPASINTPFFEHARSKLGVLPRPVPPVYDPRVVAEAIVAAAQHPQPEIVAGGAGQLFELLESISVTLLDWYMTSRARLFRQQRTEHPDDGRDNLFAPLPEAGSAMGSFGDEARPVSRYTRHIELHPWRKRALTAAALLSGVLLLRRAGRSLPL